MILKTLSTEGHSKVRSQFRLLLFLVVSLAAVPPVGAATVTVDCNAGGTVRPILNGLKTGDALLVQGTCQENILIQAQLQHITLDGQRKATIKAPDPSQPAIQVLGREIAIKGFNVIGGSFGSNQQRSHGGVDGNTIENAANTGLEVSQNSFARIVNNTIERSGQNGIFVLGSASAHIGVISTGRMVPRRLWRRRETHGQCREAVLASRLAEAARSLAFCDVAHARADPAVDERGSTRHCH
jgi:hypothetical protein